ncbi:mannosyltransferase family protein [Actinosynnema sp. NPDC023587]|uniref:mannosyltransferase family protein n=1 Tax=Actinosynnema sp. NPDC023587 TaxID=3154695 RepID=UPI0034053CF5
MTDVMTPAVAAPEDRPARTGSRWRAFAASDWGRTFALVFAWHAALTAVAVLFQGSLPVGEGYPVEVLGPDATLLSHTYRWDAENFHNITMGGYGNEATPWVHAFYPFFPFCLWLVQTVTFGKLGFLGVGIVVNGLASWFAATALLKIARHFTTGERAAWLTVAAFLTAPTAFFMHAYYSEAVFCALGFWAFLFALRRQWVWMGLLLIPLTATRITAALFVGLCFLEFFRSKDWKPRGLLSWHLLWFPAAGLGVVAYAVVLKVVDGDALAMFHAYDTVTTWGYHQADPNIFGTVYRELVASWDALASGRPTNWQVLSHLLPTVGLIVLLASSVYAFVALRKDGIPLAAFGLASFVMFTLNSNVVSVHRYLLPCLVIYVVMVLAAQRRPALWPVLHGWLYLSTLVQSAIFLLFVSGNWAG